MLLKDLLAGVEVIGGNYNGKTDINGIQYDSRLVAPGDVFICIKGFTADGHEYAEDALKKGAAAIVAQDGVMHDKVIKVRDTRTAMAKMAATFYGNPSKKFTLIGVTGTNGKTTVINLIRWALKNSGFKVGLIGTISIIMDDEEIPSTHTTPEAVDLQRIFKKMADRGIQYVVMEVSSHSLALHRVDECDFDIAVFTNLTQDHLDFHKTMENYMNAKLRLFNMTKSSVINIDDPYGEIFAAKARKPVYTYGNEKSADIKASNVVLKNDGVEFDLHADNITSHIIYPVPGKFSVYNALSALSILKAIGADLKDEVYNINDFKGVKGRCEVLDYHTHFRIIIDYAHTPAGLENILKAVRGFTVNRLIIVFGCGGDRDKSKRPQMGRIVVKYADYSVITSDNPRSEHYLWFKLVRLILYITKKEGLSYAAC